MINKQVKEKKEIGSFFKILCTVCDKLSDARAWTGKKSADVQTSLTCLKQSRARHIHMTNTGDVASFRHP